MCGVFFIKHVTGIKETSSWFKFIGGPSSSCVLLLLTHASSLRCREATGNKSFWLPRGSLRSYLNLSLLCVGVCLCGGWDTPSIGTPLLLARDCSQGIVRRHYLGESNLPTVPFSGWVIIAINALE
jgi:hypothetical protein